MKINLDELFEPLVDLVQIYEKEICIKSVQVKTLMSCEAKKRIEESLVSLKVKQDKVLSLLVKYKIYNESTK